MAPDDEGPVPAAGPDGSGGPHVLVDDLASPTLRDEDRHHLTRVVRLRAGDALTIGDGRGGWCDAVLGDEPEPVGEVQRTPRPAPALTVACALVKGERPELVVQKLTELGIDRIVLFGADRSVVRWDEARAERNVARLTRVAREASMQCRRTWLPDVTTLRGAADVAALRGAARCDRGGPPPTLATPTLLVGPEGGWSDEERALDVPTVGLADLQLRTETAAIAAGTILAALRSGLVGPGALG